MFSEEALHNSSQRIRVTSQTKSQTGLGTFSVQSDHQELKSPLNLLETLIPTPSYPPSLLDKLKVFVSQDTKEFNNFIMLDLTSSV